MAEAGELIERMFEYEALIQKVTDQEGAYMPFEAGRILGGYWYSCS